jgi:hypothetical protein
VLADPHADPHDVTLCVRHVDDVSPRNRLVDDEELELPAMAKADDEYYTAAGKKN